ncbi:unnamed protein product [Porites evermanni]|uniref:Uncharacterized protein n=1 Tax=Porites evermanni TaxID=104178 RepID=A0ABN8SCI2_9CNID|nr:unnamed protein product [Porites evermanni]
MAVPTGRDMTWLQTGWEQNQGRSSHIRHYRPPAPSEKGASRNSLLQCNKMSVKIRQIDDKAQQIRFKYGKSNLERNFKKGVDLTPFVTKVQIRKMRERDGVKPVRDTTEGGRVRFATESDKNQLDVDTADKNTLSSHAGIENDTATNEENTKDEGTFAEVYYRQVHLCGLYRLFLALLQVFVIKTLSRRFRNPIEASRGKIPAARPTAAFAKPTKGEIALSIKGPILLAPVSKTAIATAQASERLSRLEDTRSLSEFAGSRNGRARPRPISSVSDSVIITGRNIHASGRWLGSEHAPNSSLNQNNRLCHSCNEQRSARFDSSIAKQRAKSALCGRINERRKSEGCAPHMFHQYPVKAHGKTVENGALSPKRRQKMRSGMISPFELQVHLDQLKSCDFGSPVPPPSLSNSDDEEIIMP